MKIGIFGGTFDPPHIGHMMSASSAALQMGLDLLYIIPAGVPPHKKLPENSPSNEMRLRMTCFASENIENAVVSGIEMKREGKSYTIDTVEEIASRYPKAKLCLLYTSKQEKIFPIQKGNVLSWRALLPCCM